MEQNDPQRRLLFRRFPNLVGKLHWIPLADLPTPVQRLEKIGREIGASNLWVKRDDLDSDLYAGNKPRKLEFIFGDCMAKGRREIVAFGGAGSNHAVATALYGKKLGLNVSLALTPQPVLSYVRQNILVNQGQGAHMVYSANEAVSVGRQIGRYLAARLAGKVPPYLMWFGGTNRVGIAGFVEAGLELAEQIKAGQMPEPRRLFVATGSCGTQAGLMIGFALAGLKTEVIGVRVVPKLVTNQIVVAAHANRAVRYFRALDPNFPSIRFGAAQVRLLDDYFGREYGRPTPEGKQAIDALREQEDLILDPTYTGKTFAGLADFVKKQGSVDEPIIFWHTYNRMDLAPY